MAGRKKIVRLKEGSTCEECPLRENTLYNNHMHTTQSLCYQSRIDYSSLKIIKYATFPQSLLNEDNSIIFILIN
jgi:hypothetical protein